MIMMLEISLQLSSLRRPLEAKYNNVQLGSISNQEKRYTLHVADQDANISTVKIATQLNNRMGALKIGSVIEILKFTRGAILAKGFRLS
jgi:hypothetical protein